MSQRLPGCLIIETPSKFAYSLLVSISIMLTKLSLAVHQAKSLDEEFSINDRLGFAHNNNKETISKDKERSLKETYQRLA